VREYVALHLQLPVLATQSREFLSLGGSQPVVAHTGVTIGLRYPVEDRLCGRLELARELLRCAPGLEQFHHLRPEFRRVRRTSLAHFGTSLPERIGVRFGGSTSV
jgi:hypothetical protein